MGKVHRLLTKALTAIMLLWLGAGCAATGSHGDWGAAVGWPSGSGLASAAAKAARNPNTWIPAAGALIFGLTDLDDEVSDRAVDEAPVFGSNAEDASDTLRNVAAASYLVTALMAPSDSLSSRANGLLVGGSALLTDRVLVDALKDVTGRERPDGSNDASFPSGHTSLASTSASMAVGNLAYVDMPHGVRIASNIGLYGTAAATGWARVEAGKHYPSDVLAGYAIGSFLARFAYHAFLESGTTAPVSVNVMPLPGGGQLSVTIALP
ncbi:MAG: phosphatase PAP2 family protein [Pseudomonadales bacterium]